MKSKFLLIAATLIIAPSCSNNSNSWHEVNKNQAVKISLNICDKWRLTDNLTIKYKDDKYYAGGWVNAKSNLLEYSIDEGYLKIYSAVVNKNPVPTNNIHTVDYTLVQKEKNEEGMHLVWSLLGYGEEDYHETRSANYYESADYFTPIAKLSEACMGIVVDYELYPLALLPELVSRYGEDFESATFKAKGNDSLIVSAKTIKSSGGYHVEYYYHYENGLLVESIETYFDGNNTKYIEFDILYDHESKVQRPEEVSNPEEWASEVSI